ncbi:MAG: ADP-glyceromanno-heptose 6-epimerase [Brevinematales bacterium]|jgi:ADP-L-glycero-D-manno-heptose 6-epimerase
MIIVTGGAGFIGSNLVKGLNAIQETDILIVDDLLNGDKHRNLNSLVFADYMDRLDFISGLDKFKGAGVTAVFHQGACSDTMEKDGRYMMENNYEYSKKLFNFCIDRKIQFIYASSASVYGDGSKGFTEERVSEYPLNIYAYSKFLFDQYVRKFLPSCRSQVAGLRYFNVYGPQENHKGRMASVICHFHDEIKKDGTMRLFEGSDGFLRDFVFVRDIVDLNLHFYKNPVKKGIFNCGTGNAESFLRIAEIMKSVFTDSKIEFKPFPDDLKGKYQAFTRADLTSLRSTGGYTSGFTSLEEGVTYYAKMLKDSGGYYLV